MARFDGREDTAWFVNRGGGPFSLVNWNRISPEQMLGRIDSARKGGAAGVVLHSLYHYTAADSGGRFVGVESEGYGVLPRTEYFDALRKAAVRP
jgi:hypothetical protein